MGCQIYTKPARYEVAFKQGAWQVIEWLGRVCPRERPPGMSNWEWTEKLDALDFPASTVVATHAAVPTDYAQAQAGGWLTVTDRGGDLLDADGFGQIREFLAQAAVDGLPVSGSY